MRNETGWRSHLGENSVRKIATPSERGTAMVNAMAAEIRVPKISGSAPNCSATGSQTLVVTKERPYRWIASAEPRYSS